MSRCTTCGATIPAGAPRCTTCGAASGASVATDQVADVHIRLGFGDSARDACPRCGYPGPGIPYFSRTGNLALLVGVGVFTYGFGALVYWLARHNDRVCPQCGLRFERTGRGSGRRSRASKADPDTLPDGGTGRRVAGSIFALLGAFLMMIGLLVEQDPAAVVVGSMFGAFGAGLFFWGWKALQNRREAIKAGLQRRILRLATETQGLLTVTEVAAALEMSLLAAERLLDSMDDGLRVRSEVTDEGVIVYEFPEVLHRVRLRSVDSGESGLTPDS